MKTGLLLERLADDFAWYLIDVVNGYDADDLALMYEYVYEYGKKSQETGEYWLHEPEVREADSDTGEVFDKFVPCRAGDGSDTSLLNGGSERHLLAARLWQFLAFSTLGNDHPWGPLQVGALDEIIQFLRCFVNAWCEAACEGLGTLSGCSDEELYELVVHVLRSDDNVIPVVEDDHRIVYYELEQ